MTKTLRKLEAEAGKQAEINHYYDWVGSLPAESYLHLMFKGTEEEVAEQIKNDFGQNWMTRLQELYGEIDKEKQWAGKLEKKIEDRENEFSKREQELLEHAERVREIQKRERDQIAELAVEKLNQEAQINGQRAIIAEHEATIQRLKAKLYDLQNPEG